MDFETIIRKRTATRKFSSNKPEEDKIKSVLEAFRLAPTAKNFQPQRVIVAKSDEALVKIDKVSPCRYNAPVVFIVCSDKDIAFSNGNHSTYEMDACIATTQMMLEAVNVGLDTIWIEMFDKEALKKEFSLPSSLEPICLLPVGYKASSCPVNPNHVVRRKIEEISWYV